LQKQRYKTYTVRERRRHNGSTEQLQSGGLHQPGPQSFMLEDCQATVRGAGMSDLRRARHSYVGSPERACRCTRPKTHPRVEQRSRTSSFQRGAFAVRHRPRQLQHSTPSHRRTKAAGKGYAAKPGGDRIWDALGKFAVVTEGCGPLFQRDIRPRLRGAWLEPELHQSHLTRSASSQPWRCRNRLPTATITSGFMSGEQARARCQAHVLLSPRCLREQWRTVTASRSSPTLYLHAHQNTMRATSRPQAKFTRMNGEKLRAAAALQGVMRCFFRLALFHSAGSVTTSRRGIFRDRRTSCRSLPLLAVQWNPVDRAAISEGSLPEPCGSSKRGVREACLRRHITSAMITGSRQTGWRPTGQAASRQVASGDDVAQLWKTLARDGLPRRLDTTHAPLPDD
jgi:hypothetical protein